MVLGGGNEGVRIVEDKKTAKSLSFLKNLKISSTKMKIDF